ncbi:uncharacterized protein LOC122789371 isoform X2 [Protopterus annectens]|uniref:uncharacterized protein LOC122789371 isoform X2 n=1 Tax=Protopterus annectens TaxID=7888 RepID=UPI001CFB077E|nr:uncharacterized protein LOC122789371 isoform X2 [Protopterus annectens]
MGILQRIRGGKDGSGFSQYFAGCEDKERPNVSMTVQKKETTLKRIVKKTEARTDKENKPEMSLSISRGSVISEGSRADDMVQTLMTATVHSVSNEMKYTQQQEHFLEKVENCSQLHILETKYSVDERQTDQTTGQMLPCAVDEPNTESEKRNSFSSGITLPNPNHSEAPGRTNSKQKKHCSEDKTCDAERASLGKEELNSSENKLFPSKLAVKISPVKSLLQTSMRKSPSQSSFYTKKDLVKTTSDEELLTLEKFPLRSLFMKNNTEKTNQNKPTANRDELSLVPISSHSEIKCRPSEEFFQEKMECVEYVPRKLKLQRQKKP